MKTKIWAFLILSVITLLSSLSCQDDDIDCGPFPRFFKLTGLELVLYKVELSSDQNRMIGNERIEGNTVSFDEFAIGIFPDSETYGWNNPVKSFGLITVANACSPAPPESEEEIDNIIITTNQDFNPNYPQGENLAEIFDIIVYDDSANFNGSRLDLNTFIGMNPVVPYESYLLLKEQPDSITNFKFNVQFYVQGIDGDFFEFTTEEVVVE